MLPAGFFTHVPQGGAGVYSMYRRAGLWYIACTEGRASGT